MPGFEVFGEEEFQHIQDVMDSGILMRYNFDLQRNKHWKAKELEEKIQSKFRIKHAHLTSSGTTALVTAIRALGIGAGDEIIMPVFTFVASFEAILFSGAIPVLVDVDDTLTLSPSAVEEAISPRTKAIMPVHICGAMADLDALLKIAKKHSLYLIEDACQATGATYNGNYLGTLGDVGCLSFDFVKTVTCGEGGAVLTQNSSVYNLAHPYSDHGHDHIGNDRGAEGHPIIGMNFRISELNAAIGLAQFGKLDEILKKQRQIKAELKAILQKIPEIKFRRILYENGDNASFLSFFLSDENINRNIALELKNKGIPSAYWFDNNWHYVRKWEHLKNLKNSTLLYKEQLDLLPDYENQNFSASDEIMKKCLSIPISLKWNSEKIEEIGNAIIETVLKYQK
ncbi:MAG: DegT/DnrJ/EryC1/StrS family aminotransferase [Weeksellaceae bacterium]|nr:DegT/DnrJ/EryC1/StrS family aminotransferase [Weeksellaceae bacterium]